MKRWNLLLAITWSGYVIFFAQLFAIVPAPSAPAEQIVPNFASPGIIPIPGIIPQNLEQQTDTVEQQTESPDDPAEQDTTTLVTPEQTVSNPIPAGLEITPIPQPDQPADQTQEAVPDTVELPDKEIGVQGNWMKKKEWLKRAYEVYDQIQNLGVQIQTSRSTFNQKFNSIDDELDQFYKNYGVQQGKLDELFASVTDFLEKKKQRELAALTAERQQDKILERDYKTRVEEIETLIKNHKVQLDQLKFNMKSIEELDRSISERLTRLDQQVDTALQLINQGNTLVASLWHIIDDSIARTKYYELVNNVQAPLQATYTYLTNDLQNDFDQVAGTIRQQIAKVLDDTRQLEAAGLVLKNRAPRLEEIRQQVKIEREKALKAEQEVEKKRQEELARKKQPKKVTPQPWWKRIFLFISALFSQFLSLITSSESPTPQKAQASSNAPTPSP